MAENEVATKEKQQEGRDLRSELLLCALRLTLASFAVDR